MLNIAKMRSDGSNYPQKSQIDDTNPSQIEPPFIIPNSFGNSSYHNASGGIQGAKLNSPTSLNQTQPNINSSGLHGNNNGDAELTRIMYETDNNGFFNMS